MSRFLGPRRLQLSVAFYLVAALVSAGSAAFGQLEDFKDPLKLNLFGGSNEKPVFTARFEPADAKPGDEVTLLVNVVLPQDHYIYDVSGTFDGRTKIKVEAKGLEAVDKEFRSEHPPKTYFSKEFNAELSKLEGTATWLRKYRIPAGARRGAVSANLAVSGQYCGSGPGGQCFLLAPPVKLVAKLDGAGAATDAAAPPAVTLTKHPYELRQRLTRAGKPQPIQWFVRVEPADAKEGDKVKVLMTATVDEGHHTFSLTQHGLGGSPTDISLRPTNLKPAVEGPEAIVADRPFEVVNHDGHSTEEYHGTVTFTQEFIVAGAAAPGEYGVEGEIRGQVCDARTCKPMPKFVFSLGAVAPPADVAPNPSEVEPDPGLAPNPDAFAEEGPPMDEAALDAVLLSKNFDPNEVTATATTNQPLIPYLLASMLGGLAALMTPCSFPMVPITVGFFLKQGTNSRAKTLNLALVYTLSIIAAFTILGVGLSLLFGGAQLTALANNPWMNLFIGVVFVGFGLSMMGLFDIAVPSWLLTWTANKESTGGYAGVIFMAITFALTSFTCTFPVAGAVAAAAAQGDVWWPVMGMLAFSTAFALPFFLLALFPRLLQQIPKSGGWMYTVKVTLGFLELGAALKFFSIADFSLNSEPVLFDFVFVMVAWAALALATGLYLLGIYHFSHDMPKDRIPALQALLGIAFLGMSAYLLVGILRPEKAGGELMPQILAFAPPVLKSEAGGAINSELVPEEIGPSSIHNGLRYALVMDKAVQHARQIEQPIFFDFTGVNCVNCRLMEKKMEQPGYHSKLQRFVLAQIYSDLPAPGIRDEKLAEQQLERSQDLQARRLGKIALPQYVITSPDGETILSRMEGLEQNAGDFGKFLDRGWENFQKWRDAKSGGTMATAPEESQKIDDANVKNSYLVPATMKTTHIRSDFRFILDVDEAANRSRRVDRPLVMFATAVNDVNSRLNERRFLAPSNHEVLSQFVTAQAYVDMVPIEADVPQKSHLVERAQCAVVNLLGQVFSPGAVVLAPDSETVLGKGWGIVSDDLEARRFMNCSLQNFENWQAGRPLVECTY